MPEILKKGKEKLSNIKKTPDIEIRKREFFNRFFLWALGVNVIALGEEHNWDELTAEALEENLYMLIVFLTHKDYIDGSVALASTDYEVEQKMIVQKEGFDGKGFEGGGQDLDGRLGIIRKWIAQIIAPTILLSKKTNPELLKKEKERILNNLEPGVAITLFPTGTRNLLAPILGGVDFMVTEDMVIPLGIMLSDTKPIFASKQTVIENIKSLFSRIFNKRETSNEFILKINGLTSADYQRMSDLENEERVKRDLETSTKERIEKNKRRKKATAKLEVFRAYGVLKLFYLVGLGYPDKELNPLLENEDNIPLLQKSYALLEEAGESLVWLCENTTPSSGDTNTYLDREELLEILAYYKENKVLGENHD